jgi:hypothetical protein
MCVPPCAECLVSVTASLANFFPLLEGLCSAGLLPPGVWEAPARLGYVYDIPTPFRQQLLCMQVLSSALLGLVFTTGHRVLCSRRPTRRRILHSLGWGPRQALGVPLPLVVAPQGMPRQPCLCVLVTSDAQLHAEPPVWLSYTVLGGGWWRTCVVPSFLTGPLTTGWATRCTRCWGVRPLAW